MSASSIRRLVSKNLLKFYGLSGHRSGLQVISRRCSTEKENEAVHSEDESEFFENEDDLKKSVLDKALAFVPTHGWSQKAISKGAEELGYPGVAHGMFTRGGVDLALHFCDACNQTLAARMKTDADAVLDAPAARKPVRSVIGDAVQSRLTMIHPYIEQWPQALGLLVMPQHAPESVALLQNLVDDIWFYAGDKSIDVDWYTKRLTLASVYVSTELYMTQDRSPGFADTWQFMESRIDNLSTAGEDFTRCSPMQSYTKYC
ncbi:PREDICTED: ubiquinone biosynthesis protein COQ9, mitochondrial-like [Priapulus caudatus]|uniref:Ubiquinone biosynthesis protein n=1 Tax=Priapulus caudatus TaxID=37621 RepID=A0ABM1EXT0_PRICU|nr:PREDICTED: ubiquinone biosynthesis protein COQ9, mitochondrial-like [Priapulus caudatus]